jgi:tetratricopeptide (TPR) repeat protein
VRSRGGGEVRKDREQTPVSREAETWVDEGRIEDEVRDAAAGAVRRALAPRRTVSARPKDEDELDPQTKADVAKVLEPVRANRLSGRLKAAQIALERERYSEAKRIAKSLTKELSGVAAVHEVIGLASYRMGQWRDATAALELARSIRLHIEDMPVLADCYRAQRRWNDVDAVWAELKELSPSPEVMAEGRMVAAGSLSDRGELKDAIELMLKVAAIPRRVHEYHLKQWYVLGDLYDKAGNVQKAREFFQRVALHDKEYADVSERLASL